MKEKNKNLKAITLSSVQLPHFREINGKEWVTYGGDNLYPEFLTGLYNKSAINRRCITAKADATYGKGLTLSDNTKNYILKRANPYESWDEVFEKISLDYIVFGGYAFNVIWNADATKIVEIYHLDFSKVRSGKLNEDDQVDYYWHSSCWDRSSSFQRYVKPTKYCAFSPERAKEAAKTGNKQDLSQILYVKTYNPDQMYYPLPDYIGSVSDIQIDIEISTLHLSNLSNGLTPSLWISMTNGIPDDEGKRMLYQEISDSFSGAANAGRFFLTFSDGKDTAPEITPITSANDTFYNQLEERITSRILSGHGISSPLLIGLRVGGSGLGSNADEIETAWAHLNMTVIKPIQKQLTKTLNTLIYYFGYPNESVEIVPQAKFFNENVQDTNIQNDPTKNQE